MTRSSKPYGVAQRRKEPNPEKRRYDLRGVASSAVLHRSEELAELELRLRRRRAGLRRADGQSAAPAPRSPYAGMGLAQLRLLARQRNLQPGQIGISLRERRRWLRFDDRRRREAAADDAGQAAAEVENATRLEREKRETEEREEAVRRAERRRDAATEVAAAAEEVARLEREDQEAKKREEAKRKAKNNAKQKLRGKEREDNNSEEEERYISPEVQRRIDRDYYYASSPAFDNVGTTRLRLQQVDVGGDGFCLYRAFGLAFYNSQTNLGSLTDAEERRVSRLVRERIQDWWFRVTDRSQRHTPESRARLPWYRALNVQGIRDARIDRLNQDLDQYHLQFSIDQNDADNNANSPTTVPVRGSLAYQVQATRGRSTNWRGWPDLAMVQLLADAFDVEILVHMPQYDEHGTLTGWGTMSRGIPGARQIHLFNYPNAHHFTMGRVLDQDAVWTDHLSSESMLSRRPLLSMGEVSDEHYENITEHLPRDFDRELDPPVGDVTTRTIFPPEYQNFLDNEQSWDTLVGEPTPADQTQTNAAHRTTDATSGEAPTAGAAGPPEPHAPPFSPLLPTGPIDPRNDNDPQRRSEHAVHPDNLHPDASGTMNNRPHYPHLKNSTFAPRRTSDVMMPDPPFPQYSAERLRELNNWDPVVSGIREEAYHLRDFLRMHVDGNAEYRNPARDGHLEEDAVSDTELEDALPDLAMIAGAYPRRREFFARRNRLRREQVTVNAGTAMRVLEETVTRWQEAGDKDEDQDDDDHDDDEMVGQN